MPDFRLSEKAWAAASKELRAIGRHPSDDDRLLIELSCDIYVRCHRAIGRPFSPAKHAEAWRAVSKKADGLLRAIDCLREVGAAELEFLGYEMAKTIRGNLSDLSSAALVVAEIEANGPRIPPKLDPGRDRLASVLMDTWRASTGVAAGKGHGGPASRFLDATFSEAVVAAGEARPTMGALRDVLRKHERLNRRTTVGN